MAYRDSAKHGEYERDEVYPADAANKRPKLMTRLFCDKEQEADTSSDTESRCERFNNQLRSGQQQINQD